MALSNVMFDMRRFAKTKQFMDMEDPDQVSEAVNAYVKKNIQAAAVGGKRVRARVNETLETLRNSIYMGHIKTSDNAEQVARISMLMQQVGEGQLEETKAATNTLKSTGEAIKNNLPSMDSIVAAVTTANPLVGFGIKMMRDVTRAAVQTRKDRQAVAEKQLKAAEEKLKMEKEGQKADMEQGSGEFDTPDLESYREKVYGRLSGIEELNRDSQKKFDMIGERSENTNQSLQTIAGLLRRDIEATEALNQKADFAKTEQRREKAVEANKGISERTHGASGSMDLLGLVGRGGAAVLGGIGAAAGAMFLGALTKIKNIFTSVLRAGKTLGRFGLRAFPITAAVMGLWDFGKGFVNANEIAGKEDTNLWEKYQAGIASVGGSFVKMFDDLTNLFGVDLIDTTNIDQRIYQAIDGMSGWVVGQLSGLVDKVKSFLPEWDFEAIQQRIVDGFNSVKDSILDRISSLWDRITDAIPTWDDIKDSVGNVMDNLKFWENDVTDQERREAFGNMDTQGMRSMDLIRGASPSHSMGDAMRETPGRGGSNQTGGVQVNNVDNSQTNQSTNVFGGGQRSRSDEPLSRQSFNRSEYMLSP